MIPPMLFTSIPYLYIILYKDSLIESIGHRVLISLDLWNIMIKKKLVLREGIDTPRASVLKIEDSHLNPRKLTNLCPTRTRGPVPKWVCFDHVPSEWG